MGKEERWEEVRHGSTKWNCEGGGWAWFPTAEGSDVGEKGD